MGTMVMSNYGAILPCAFLAWVAIQAFFGIRKARALSAIQRRLQW